MKNFTIVSIEGNKVVAREVNPRGDKLLRCNTYESKIKNCQHFFMTYRDYKKAWLEAESNLKEYTLTEESLEINIGDLIIGHNRLGGITGYRVVGDYQECDIECEIRMEDIVQDVNTKYFVGQTIQGEIVKVLGEEKVKVL